MAAELDERVDERRQRGDAGGLEPLGAPRQLEPEPEVVAREREPGALDQRAGVARLAGEHAAQQRVGASVEAGVAGLAHALQVGGGELDARLGRRGRAPGDGLQARDLGLRAGGGALAAGERRGGRGGGGEHVALRQREQREAEAEGEEDGREEAAAGCEGEGHGVRGGGGCGARPAPRTHDPFAQAGGCGTGAWPGSTRFGGRPVNPSPGCAT